MKYKKGTFVTVPNREVLRGLSPTTQALFMWLCSYSDNEGICFPSRETLAQDCGVSERSIGTHIKKLESCGLVQKTKRKMKGNYQYESNLYQILIAEAIGKKQHMGQTIGKKRQNHRKKTTQTTGNSCRITKPIELNPVNSTEQSSEKKQIDQIIDVFYQSVNPTINWGNTTNRSAAADLLNRFGLKGTLKMAKQICSVQGKDRYVPVATTPYQMREKLAQFKIYFEKENNSNNIVKI